MSAAHPLPPKNETRFEALARETVKLIKPNQYRFTSPRWILESLKSSNDIQARAALRAAKIPLGCKQCGSEGIRYFLRSYRNEHGIRPFHSLQPLKRNRSDKQPAPSYVGDWIYVDGLMYLASNGTLSLEDVIPQLEHIVKLELARKKGHEATAKAINECVLELKKWQQGQNQGRSYDKPQLLLDLDVNEQLSLFDAQKN